MKVTLPTPKRLALFGTLLIGATICPQLLAVSNAPEVLKSLAEADKGESLKSWAGMLAGIFGGLVADDLGELAKRLERKDTTNHDLAKATGEAISLVLTNLATTKDLDPELTQKLKTLAEVAEDYWLEISQESKDSETPLDIPETELVQLMSHKAEDFKTVKALDTEAWQNAVRALDTAAKTKLKARWIRLTASQLHRTFPQALREILKADAQSGGKAYAAMSLSLMGEMVALAKERQRFAHNAPDDVERLLLDILQRSQPEQQAAFCQAMARVESGLAGVLEQAKQEILDTLRVGFYEVNERLDEIGEDVGDIKAIIAQQKPRIGTQTGGNFRGVSANWQGREPEIQQLKAWIFDADVTLMGIEGMGGLGKTSLAAKVFDELKTQYGGYWADVSTGVGFAEVARGVLEQFARPIPEQETMLADALVACLQNNRCLLVFDNLETVLRGGQFVEGSLYEQFFRGWLNRHSQSAVLVTTRERPSLRGFNHWLPLAGWSEAEGAAFLRAKGIQGEESELQAFSGLVEGYPLLLRFVADLLLDESPQNPRLEQLSVLGLASLSELLTHPEVRGTHRQADVGMVAVLDVSYGRLSETAKTLLHSVSVLTGEFEAEVALAVSGLEIAATEVAAALRQLARQSWLLEDEVEGRRIYSFQQVVLAYVQHQAGTLTEARRRAVAYYQQRAKPRTEWETLEDVREYLEIFEQFCQLEEYEVAFATLQDGDDVDDFLDLRGYNSTRVELHSQLVENWQEGDRHNLKFGAALISLGDAYNSLGQSRRAIDLYQQSLEIMREIGDRRGEASSLGGLGNTYHFLGQYQRAIDFYQQSLEIKREIGDRRGEAISLDNLGSAYHSLGQYQRAIDFCQQSLEINRELVNRGGEAISLGNLDGAYYSIEIKREIGDRRGEASSLGNLGGAYYSLGQYQRAIDFSQQSLEIARNIGDRRGEATFLNNLGIAYDSLGQSQRAIDFYQQSLEIARNIGDRRGEARSLNNLGNAYDSLGQYQRAIDFQQQWLEISREIGDRRGEATSLQNLARAYHQTGRAREGYQAAAQATQILQELELPLDAYPIPKWQKAIARFAQRGNAQLALCFILGLFAFPFALAIFVLLFVWRWLRQLVRR